MRSYHFIKFQTELKAQLIESLISCIIKHEVQEDQGQPVRQKSVAEV